MYEMHVLVVLYWVLMLILDLGDTAVFLELIIT
jgi:hypothetical protein